MNSLFLYCRSGFEKECAAEIQSVAGHHGLDGYCNAQPGTGYVLFNVQTPAAPPPANLIQLASLVFTRQWFTVLGRCSGLPAGDRVSPLMTALAGLPGPVSEVWIESPDTHQGKALSRLCRSLRAPLQAALAQAGRLARTASELRLHVCLLDADEALVGVAERTNSAPWPAGVPRLKASRNAPSRAALKLEEALLRFLGQEARNRLLRPGVSAVDLGAAPGGWTWLLTEHGVSVIAVDNGSLAPPLRDSPLVRHLCRDGLTYRPPGSVDWMVCDIVEQPIKIAALAERWVREGWCRRTIFNLKLPMKKRYAEVGRCLQYIGNGLNGAHVAFNMQCKQLYHDREEVTVLVERRTSKKADTVRHARIQ